VLAVTVDRRAPLAHCEDRLAEASTAGLSLQEVAFGTVFNLRLDPSSPVAEALGLPGAGRAALIDTQSGIDGAVGRLGAWWALWLGPDEWLLTGGEDRGELLRAWLAPQLAEVGRSSLVDVSANHATLLISGRYARDVLEKAITLDLHPRSFAAGSCATTTFARGNVLLWQVAGEGYRLMFRPSFGTYFCDWLIDAAAEFR
jgi:sarcosine oxidase subunit gamma